MMRLDRMLSDMGVSSRSQTKKAIRQKRICINGIPARTSDVKIDPDSDQITIDGFLVAYQKYAYFMLNKPQGVISATEGGCETVLDLIDSSIPDLFPVGRLDKDTVGLLLITNDGELAHNLLSPSKHVDKEYEVELLHPLSDEDILKIEKGIRLHDEEFQPAVYKKMDDLHCRLVIHEGKYHQIKRMMEALQNEVVFLKRIRMKNLVLDENLQLGQSRELTAEELRDLKEQDR